MKKKFFLIVIMLFSSILLISCNGGNSNKVQLSVPTNVTVDGTTLSWDSVDGATEYVIIIDSARHTSTTTSFNLSSLNLNYGTYKIQVAAKAGDKESEPSAFVNYKLEESITYLAGERKLFYYEDESLYRFFFNFLNENEETMAGKATIDMRIVNDSGVEVYKKTQQITKSNYGSWTSGYYTTITIPYSQVSKGNSSTGKLYFQIHTDAGSFNEFNIKIEDLPVNFSLILPTLPLEVSGSLSFGVTEITKLTSITYEYANNRLELKFSGTKLYYYWDESHGHYIEVRLLTSEGVFVASRSFRTPSIYVGDSFANTSLVFNDVEPGDYIIEIKTKQ